MNQDESAATNEPHEDDEIERAVQRQPTIAPGAWVKRAVLLIVAVAVTYLLFRISAAFFPRWWAQRVANQVDGTLTAGVLWGLFYGFTFTFIPVLILFQVRRSFFGWTGKVVVAVIAVAVAAPNLMTLSVVVGNSNAAHAGGRIMDVDAPGFRAATLVAAIVGVGLGVLVSGTTMAMKRRKSQVRKLEGERDELRNAQRDSDRSDD